MMIKLFLVGMLIFAFLSIKTRQLRDAVIYLSIFSLTNAVVYLFYGAPDVSLAEAIVSSTLSTILYLIAIKKYNPTTFYQIHGDTRFPSSHMLGKKRDVLLGALCTSIGLLTIKTYISTLEVTGSPAWEYYVSFFKQDTGANNAVTAIYLNYRVFDTLFEALLLLVSVIAVIYFSWRGGK